MSCKVRGKFVFIFSPIHCLSIRYESSIKEQSQGGFEPERIAPTFECPIILYNLVYCAYTVRIE